ncbi:helix-turn-helix transcriptional regulator [Proteinivorax hydrogeniformans]|uniref:Helix-turn-helix transcriptional regulator n=1 Tax=Proteinivorax hydrogeniformans TaxID=1826727 RepID=A0AAU8HSR7_9FIRM
MTKKFNKKLMLDNIAYLLKDAGKKIGELESDAGVSPGYISRISKEGNTKPGIDFIMNVADSLNVSINTLLNVELTEMTPNERYLLSFLEKLNKDTIDDKLDWNCESADWLNRAETDKNSYSDHPLLSYETFYEEGEGDYPNEVSRVVFVSKSFDCKTSIYGDCFNLRLKNGSILYIMNISKSVYRVNDPNAFAKEIWMYIPGTGTNFLCRNNEISPLADLVDELYSTVSERMKHPRVKGELQYVIDSFMKDDVSDDDDTIPF